MDDLIWAAVLSAGDPYMLLFVMILLAICFHGGHPGVPEDFQKY